jgi:hypothetical protein
VAFTQKELENSNQVLYVTMFDQEVREEQITKMRKMSYTENKYLGSFQIPLTTILQNPKLDGQIRLNRPLVIQNY